MRRKSDELEKYYCMKCKGSTWMREVLDSKESDKDGMKCIICGTIHRHPNLWKKPPKTI
jgi:uncharacterized Zn finger protein